MAAATLVRVQATAAVGVRVLAAEFASCEAQLHEVASDAGTLGVELALSEERLKGAVAARQDAERAAKVAQEEAVRAEAAHTALREEEAAAADTQLASALSEARDKADAATELAQAEALLLVEEASMQGPTQCALLY